MTKQKKGVRVGRFSARRKREAVLRLLRGEDLEVLSRELGVRSERRRASRGHWPRRKTRGSAARGGELPLHECGL